MGRLCDVLQTKGRFVFSISPHASVHDAALMMNEHRVGALLVMEDGRVLGIVTERDILQKVVAESRDVYATRVREVMTEDVICLTTRHSLEDAAAIMKQRRIRHLPVYDDEKQLVGLISIGDLNAFRSHDQERQILLLEEYIYGSATPQ